MAEVFSGTAAAFVKNAHWTGSLLIQEHFGSKSEILSNKSVFSISTHRLWTHFACLLQRHVWIWIHQALLLRKQRSDEKKICWLTLLIAPCYSYCIWLITPAFCSLKHWETPRDSSCLDSSRLVGQLHTCETAMVLSVQYHEYYVSLQRKHTVMQCMAPSQAPPAAAPCVPVGSLWVLACHLHHFATLLDSFDSLCYLLLQTHVKHHATWADDGGSQHYDMEGSAHWHSDTLGASLGAGAFAAPFASQKRWRVKMCLIMRMQTASCQCSQFELGFV